MGRHAAPAPEPDGRPVPPEAPERQAPPEPQRRPAPAHGWWEHAVLSGVAGLAVGGVMAWASGPSLTAALGGLATCGVVLLAAWLAGRLPHHRAGPG